MTHSAFTLSLQLASASHLNLLAGALLILLSLQAVGAFALRRVTPALHLTQWVMGLVGGLALLTTLLWGSQSAAGVQLNLDSHNLALGFGVDRLGSAMVALVGSLGFIILRFSNTYLRSEAKRLEFLSRLTWTITFVQAFALSTNLIGHALLWLLISVSVHRLLRHYEERPRAILAAKKKFLMSRLADLAFWSSLLLLWDQYGTLDVQELAESATNTAPNSWALFGICLAVLMKSAQFPFHSWLPETMDAPTPVSAVMHAGVVNAGAFLLLRIAPLLEQSAPALLTLAVAGAVTAAFGMLVGSVQPTLKARLAYSTIAQMGFLFFELGLGLIGAAALHLAAHALYKAHAFLRSGTPQLRVQGTLASVPRVLRAIALSLGVYTLPLLVGTLWLGWQTLAYLPLSIVWALGTSQYLLAPTPEPSSTKLKTYFAAGGGLWGIAVVAELFLAAWFPTLPSPLAFGLIGPLLVSAALGLLGTSMVLASRARFKGPRLKSLYVHALSGFYLGEYTDRITTFLWPSPASSTFVFPPSKALS